VHCVVLRFALASCVGIEPSFAGGRRREVPLLGRCIAGYRVFRLEAQRVMRSLSEAAALVHAALWGAVQCGPARIARAAAE